MRLTSTMWFAVFMRLETQRGAFVAAVKTGAQEAGAIFIVHNHLNGTVSIYAPAPQTLASDDGGRRFEKTQDCIPQMDADKYLESQIKFDPDLWIIETESGTGEPELNF